MTLIFPLALVLTVLSFPPLYRKAFGLEWGNPRGEGLLRWLQCFLLCLISAAAAGLLKQVILLSTVSRVLIAVILTAGYAELALRCVVKYLLPPAGRRWPLCAKVHQYFTENPDNLYYSRYVPHPFLQFTGPRGPVPGTTADFYLGFKEIKLSDIPKPSGVIRVACLGGSTTADGYPESLQEFLARSAPGRKFQVLNFGSMWWSSVHSTVNYVLNVIDFKPDYLILHDSCNDHHYRGFPGLRGDCAHAYRLFQVPQTIGETLFRFSLIYRIGRTFLSWLIPSVFRRSMEMKEIGLLPGKTYNYVPAELYVIDRNIRTICTVARNEGSKVCLTTMPLSNVHTFGEEHDKVYRPHTRDVNEIIRKIARETGFPLADFDATMTGREEFFKDAVHATVAGNNAKAEAVGQVILADLKPS